MRNKRIKHILLAFISLTAITLASGCDKKESYVDFGNLSEGQTISSPFTVEMTVEGMEIRPAGEVIEGTGHFHISIDSDLVPEGELIPTNATSFHYGDARTSTELELTPGEHRLTLQFGDGIHRSLGERYSKTISIIVE